MTRPMHEDTGEVAWRRLVAIGLVAGDLGPLTISRYAGVGVVEAERALAEATAAGVLADGAVPATEAARLVADLPSQLTAEVHAAVARHLLSEGPSRLVDALRHAQAAEDLMPLDELVGLAEHGARTCLSTGDYDSARRLFEFADAAGFADPPLTRATRLCDLAIALDGLGRVADARSALARAFDIAELTGDAGLATRAAAAYALPVDWYAGDRRASALLQRAAQLPLDAEQTVTVLAARAMVEMRIPLTTGLEHQTAWVTRPSIAQPLAEQAMSGAAACSEPTRLLALLAWRSTHRSPRFLAQRREVSIEALDRAQYLRLPGRQVDVAVMLAVDALESADRPQFDRALSVLRWVAERDGNPRLGWHAHSVAAGGAHLDGDLEAARWHRERARELGGPIGTPGWFAAEMMLFGEELLARGDPEELSAHLPHDESILANPLAKLVVSYAQATLGNRRGAEQLLRRALRQFEEEASILLCATRASAAAVLLGLPDVIDELCALLEPWAHHVAVDSNAWWCDGPVSQWLALLHHARGDLDAARRRMREAEPVARRLGDIRSIERLAQLRRTLGADPGTTDEVANGVAAAFSERELAVLRLLVAGASNPEIGRTLTYSASTIRNDVTAIYRRLGVRSRPEAAARAIALGLADEPVSRPG